MWTQENAGIQGSADNNDRFGAALAAANFDGDGETDLAIGVPGSRAVQILYGAEVVGLTSQDEILGFSASISGATVDGIGKVLAAGDFNADGRGDLAVGAPDTDRNSLDTGVTFVRYGTPQGLEEGEEEALDQDIIFGPGRNETGDRFGSALAAGDFDADGYTDLAIGAPFEDVGSIADGGAGVSNAHDHFGRALY